MTVNPDGLQQSFAQTYDPPNDLDPLELREEYQQFTEYRAANPHAGRVKTANALNIPTGRARSWIDGAQPDVVKGLTAAENRNWFATDGQPHQALTRLVAGIFAAGSINDTWTPRWSATDGTGFDEALQTIDAGVTRINRNSNQHGDELEPARDPQVLGRVLYARGAPNTHVSEYELPAYLFDHHQTGRTFVQTYVNARGVVPEGRNHIQVYEQQRSDTFHDRLHQLIDQHTTGEVTRVEQGVLIHPPTVEHTSWLHNEAEP